MALDLGPLAWAHWVGFVRFGLTLWDCAIFNVPFHLSGFGVYEFVSVQSSKN